MNKLLISITVFLALISCKGPGSGPLVRQSSNKSDINKSMSRETNKSNISIEKMNVKVEPCQGCTTISNLIANKQSFSGKVIKVKGRVTKFNPEIMGKNWVHVQDGSEFNGGFDLTITTNERVSIGDTLTFEGKIALDKDFGYGYFYSVLMEEGKTIN
jgi:hypothetical protein